MFRRSRFSVRPNVGTAGRTGAAAAPQEASSTNQEASETPKDVGESSTPPAVTETKAAATPSEKPPASGDGNDQNGEGTSSTAAVQRRKRFSVKPKVAPGRPAAAARTPKSPVKAVPETPVEAPGSDLEKTATSSQTGTAAAPQGLQSPKRRRASGESKQPPTAPVPSDSPGLSAAVEEDLPEPTDLPTADSGKQLESKAGKQVKDVPPRPPDKVPPSLPDKEAVELSEKAKTLVSSKNTLSLTQSAFSLSRLLNDPSDLYRLAKAQKLRELLRKERDKERRLKQAKAPPREFTLDPTKMTMRDLIRYLPQSNPMSSSLDQSVQEDETVIPPSPEREKSPERAQEPELPPKATSPRDREGEEGEDGEEEEEDEESLMVPQVKVAEDGTLIIDEESLTVEVQRASKSNPANDRDPIFERGSTTTYSSFRKGTHSKPWSDEETDMFFLAISMVGTDFSMICQLFPHRARSEIKNKFKKEERGNSWRIDKAFRERRKLDIEYFSKLLEKVLEVQKNRKKLKKLTKKNAAMKTEKKRKAAKKLSDGEEEEDDDDEHESPDLEGEKENEDLCNEGASPVSKPKRQRKRKTKKDDVKEPKEKKKKSGKKNSEEGEACTPEDAEAALPEDHTSSDMTEKMENVKTSKDTAIKPAKLSRGRAPKPLLPLGRKWGKKAAPASTQAKDAEADEEDESASVEASKEQESTESSPSRKANKKKSADDTENSSEEEDTSVQPPKPTRYGRVPKRTNLLNYPGKEDAHSSASESTPTSPAGSTASAAKRKPRCSSKRGRSSEEKSPKESKKPKLVTLRASQSESSDGEDGKQWEDEEQPACSSNKDSNAPVFVPICLRSPQPVLSEVEETMEELDILANMPDVLGISQDSVCPDASCERVQNETGTPEPCEHQLDLLVDVIDFLSSEHTGAEDESYNEAAQTLLTIGNLTHLSQSAQSQTTTEDHTTGTTESVTETTQHVEEGPAPKPAEQEEKTDTLTFGHEIKETTTTDATVESQSSTADGGDVSTIKTSDQLCSEEKSITHTDPSPQAQSGPDGTKNSSPQTRRGRLPTVKPKPNLSRASRSAKTKSSPVRTVEETNTEATESPSAPEDTSSKTHEYSPSLLKDDAVSQEQSGTTTSDQSCSFSDSQSEPSGEQTNRDMRSTSETSDEKVMSATETTPSCSKSTTSIAEQEVSQHGEVASTSQSRRSRVQKVKPKPNIPQISRTARSRPNTTKDSAEKGSSSTPVSKVQVEQEGPCGASPQKPSQNVGAASSSLDVGSALSPTREQSTIEESRADVGLVGQVCPVAAASSDQSASENKSSSEGLSEPSSRDIGSTLESTDAKGATHDEASEICSDLVTSDSPVTESQVGQDIAQVQESSDQPATSVTPGEDLPDTQKAESEVESTCQPRRSRLQKVKPKPNLLRTSRTARPAPQTAKDSSPTPTSKVLETPIVEAQAEATSDSSSEKPSQSPGPVSVSASMPSINVDSATEENRADVGLAGQTHAVAAASDQSASENQSLSQDLFEHSIRDAVSAGTTASAVTPSQDTAPVPESSDQPATPVEALPDTQKVETEVMSSPPSRIVRSQKVKPKPNLAQTTRTARSKAQTTKDPVEQLVEGSDTGNTQAEVEAKPVSSVVLPVKPRESTGPASVSVPSQESCTSHKPAEESSSTPTVPQRRRQTLKVKPNLGSPIRASQIKVQPKNIIKPSEEQHMDTSLHEISEQASADHSQTELKLAEKDHKHLTETQSPSNSGASSTETVTAQSENTIAGTDQGTSSDDVVVATSMVAENQSVLTDSAPENKSSEKSTFERDSTEVKMPQNDWMEAGPSSQGKWEMDIAPRVTMESNTQPLCVPDVPDVQSSKDSSADSKIIPVLSTDACFIPDPEESSRQPCSQSHSEVKSQDAAKQCSETRETAQTSIDKSQSSTDETELTDSPKSSKKASPTRRGRLIKPKPNLGRISRPPQPQQVQSTPQAEADSGAPSEDVDASVSFNPVPELQCDVQEPVEGAVEPHSSQDTSANDQSLLGCLTEIIEQMSQSESRNNDPASSLGCVTQAQDNSSQNTSTLSMDGSQPSLSLFPDILSEQVTSDPDEPFFILSLTEIPVCSSGQGVDSPAEPLPYLPLADASIQQHSSVPAESLATVGEEGSLSTVPVSDITAYIESITENPVDPHESATTVQPSTSSETVEKIEETEFPSKQKPTSSESRESATTVQTPTSSETVEKTEETETPSKQKPSSSESRESATTVQTPTSSETVEKIEETEIPSKQKPTSSERGESATTVQTPTSSETVEKTEETETPSKQKPTSSESRESATTVQTPTSSETVEKTEETEQKEETEIPSKQKPASSGRRAKQQVKPSTTRRKQPSRSRATKTNQDSELPGVSAEPEATDETAKGDDEVVTELQQRSGDDVNIEKESPAGGKDLEEPSSGTRTRTRRTRACSAGKSSGPSTEPPPVKSAPRASKGKAPRATRKRSAAPAPVASTSHDVTSPPSWTKPLEDEPTTASPTTASALPEVDVDMTTEQHLQLFSESSSGSSQCPTTTEVSLPQQSEGVEEEVEEPTSVSQYFLSDIFTEPLL